MAESSALTPEIVAHEMMYRKNFRWEKASHPSCVLFIIKHGTFILEMCQKKVTVSDNDVVYFSAGEPFYRKIISPMTFHYIQLSPSLSENALPLPAGKLNFIDQKRLHSTLEALNRITDLPEIKKAPWCQHLVDDLFYQNYFEAKYAMDKCQTASNDAALQAVLEYFAEHLQEKMNIHTLSQKNGLTHAGLIRKFQEELGVSPVEYLTKLRISKAKHLLLNTELSITGIAELCGFSNGYYFSNVFKKHTSYSPTQYRLTFQV